MRNVVIVMGKCGATQKGYGMRFERRGGANWVATWAFSIKESLAKKEGYENSNIEGSFSFDEKFPGCPYCSSKSFFACSCGKVSCWDSEARIVTCPWCKKSAEIGGQVTSLTAGGDR